MQRAWEALPVAQNLAADAVQFKSYEQLIKYLVPQTGNITFVDKHHCSIWLANYIKRYKKEATTTHTNTLNDSFFMDLDAIYQELRIIAGFTDVDIYQALGQKQSLFHEKDEKQWLYTACKLYQESLEKNRQIHAPFYPLLLKAQFRLIVVDEAQDFSHRQLEILFHPLHIVQENHHFLHNIITRLKDARLEKQQEPFLIPPETTKDNTADWCLQVKMQLEQGNVEIARAIYIEKLHKTANEFKELKSRFLESSIIDSSSMQIPGTMPNPIRKTVSPHKVQQQAEQEKISEYLNTLSQNLTEPELDNLLQNKKAREFLFEHPLADGACLFTNLFYKESDSEMLLKYLLKYPDILSGLTKEALCQARSKAAGKYANTSPLFWLSFQKGDFLLKLLTDHPKMANLITGKALCLPRTADAKQDANISPLFALSCVPWGLKILDIMFTNNKNLVQSITARALCLTLTPQAEKFTNCSTLYMLCCKPEGRIILYYLITRNTNLAKSIPPESLCLRVSELPLRSPVYWLSTTKDGMKILEILIRNTPGLREALKNQLEQQALQVFPSKSGLFSWTRTSSTDISNNISDEIPDKLSDEIPESSSCWCNRFYRPDTSSTGKVTDVQNMIANTKSDDISEPSSWRCNLF